MSLKMATFIVLRYSIRNPIIAMVTGFLLFCPFLTVWALCPLLTSFPIQFIRTAGALLF